MKLLRIMGSADPADGGLVEGVLRQTPVLARLGHTTTIAALDPVGATPEDAPHLPEGLRLIELGRGHTAWRWNPAALDRLTALARDHDRVVIEGLWMFHAYAGRRAALRAGTPYVVYPHGMLDPYFKRRHPLKHLKKWCFWPWAEYRVLRDARAVCFTCDQERRLARRSFPALYRARERVVGYGTEPPPPPTPATAAAFAGACPELAGAPYLLFLSRLHPKKGCDLALHAFAALAGRRPGLHLVMAGPDQLGWLGGLRRLAHDLGIEGRVHWPGMLQGEAKWGAFHGAEALFLPSHQENFGIVVAEALACGLPVLISDQVNIRHEVEQGGCGLVAPDTLAGATRLLLDWDAAEARQRRRWSTAALETFNRHFRVEGACERLLQVLAEEP